ncbi:hypothetical protein TNCV_4843821 [Trichonephila clavipes]|uniref:Uncharacterized protein n=1 Tax=Trichonephila clavipes TaxID=2585209 RepID=A0A8X6WJQ0_TRICX|nr:hypothetical protein TNCV_4843821 [Trichonephila clavipes]
MTSQRARLISFEQMNSFAALLSAFLVEGLASDSSTKVLNTNLEQMNIVVTDYIFDGCYKLRGTMSQIQTNYIVLSYHNRMMKPSTLIQEMIAVIQKSVADIQENRKDTMSSELCSQQYL